MVVAAKTKHFLDNHRVVYRTLSHQRTTALVEAAFVLGIKSKEVVQSILLQDALGVVLAVLPLNYRIDFDQLSKKLHRFLKVLPMEKAGKYFRDCEPGAYPPLGAAYGIPVILEANVAKMDKVFFEAGSHVALVELSSHDFQFATSDAIVLSFGQPKKEEEMFFRRTDTDLKANVDFPTLSSTAREILELAKKSSTQAPQKLSELIAQDPVVDAYLSSYVKLSDTPDSEITEVLGCEVAGHIALGLTESRAWQVPQEGVMGLISFWRHALSCAMLAKKIAEKIPADYAIDPRLSYVMRLFHNFGYLILGHLFSPEFRLLNKWLALAPEVPVESLEKRLLGMGKAKAIVGLGHAQLGAGLMEYWGIPESVVIVTRYHHSVEYKGAHARYVTLLQTANQLLKILGLGDGCAEVVDEASLQSLGISERQIDECLTSVRERMSSLNHMAELFVS